MDGGVQLGGGGGETGGGATVDASPRVFVCSEANGAADSALSGCLLGAGGGGAGVTGLADDDATDVDAAGGGDGKGGGCPNPTG